LGEKDTSTTHLPPAAMWVGRSQLGLALLTLNSLAPLPVTVALATEIAKFCLRFFALVKLTVLGLVVTPDGGSVRAGAKLSDLVETVSAAGTDVAVGVGITVGVAL